METYTYRGMTFEVPHLPKEGFFFSAVPGNKVTNPTKVFDKLNSIWDLSQFNYIRLPYSVGDIEFPAFKGIRILDMPIKWRGKDDYRLPTPIMPYFDIIQKTASFEMANIENHRDFYCYLTVDESFVQPDATGRNKGLHVDGFQGARITPKHRIDHSFIAVSHIPTAFFHQSFPCSHLDENKHNFF